MILQAAALPLWDNKIVLVSSRSGRRWVLPKGIIDPGKSAVETALQEAWEEAGIKGKLREPALGEYTYEKWNDELKVLVFLLKVTSLADEWPERTTRERKLVEPEEAVELMEEKDLRKLMRTHLK